MKVREVLSYQAELRLPSTVTRAHRVETVAYVIKLLGLEDVVDSVTDVARCALCSHFLTYIFEWLLFQKDVA